MDTIRKVQQQFAVLKTLPVEVSLDVAARQTSTYFGDGEFELEEMSEVIPRTPRGSSRASRVSSLAHSHRYYKKFFILLRDSVQEWIEKN